MSEEEIDVEDMDFQEAIEKLEEINDKLEMNRASLEEAIKMYELGMKLVKHCSKKLEEAEGEIKKISKKNGEEVITDMDI
ncbi:MAG: exodeoxyribonuclease VII small subunit [Thermoplasmata archaeon]